MAYWVAESGRLLRSDEGMAVHLPRRSARAARGQSLVEFALVLPVLLLLTLAVADGARVFAAQVTLTNASREAALYAARNSDATQGQVAARASVEASDLVAANLTVGAPVRTVGYVSVSLTYPIDLMTPLIGAIWGNPLTLTATTTAPVLE